MIKLGTFLNTMHALCSSLPVSGIISDMEITSIEQIELLMKGLLPFIANGAPIYRVTSGNHYANPNSITGWPESAQAVDGQVSLVLCPQPVTLVRAHPMYLQSINGIDLGTSLLVWIPAGSSILYVADSLIDWTAEFIINAPATQA